MSNVSNSSTSPEGEYDYIIAGTLIVTVSASFQFTFTRKAQSRSSVQKHFTEDER